MQLSLPWYGPRTTVKWVRLGRALLWTMGTKRAKIDAWRWNNRARLITVVPRRHIFKTLNDRGRGARQGEPNIFENCRMAFSHSGFNCQMATIDDEIRPGDMEKSTDATCQMPPYICRCQPRRHLRSGAAASSAQFHSRTIKYNNIAWGFF